MKRHHFSIFGMAFVITLFIFFIGFMLSYGLDFARFDEVSNKINMQELHTSSYYIEKEFISAFGNTSCTLQEEQLLELKEELTEIGVRLSNYGQKAVFKKEDFDYLKRKYFIMQLEMYSIIQNYNTACKEFHNYLPIILFYTIDVERSIKQGFILEELARNNNRVIVFSFDKDYEDEPLLNSFKTSYNITQDTTLIFQDGEKYEGLTPYWKIRENLKNLTNASLS